MAEMLQKLQLSVCSLRQDWGTERLHDLLDRNRLAGELVLCGATGKVSGQFEVICLTCPNQTSPKAPIPTGCRSVYLAHVSTWGEKVLRSAKATCW